MKSELILTSSEVEDLAACVECAFQECFDCPRNKAKQKLKEAARDKGEVMGCAGRIVGKTITNADHIRVMSDEELVEFLWDFNLADVSTVKMREFGPHMFRHRLKEWLQQPAEENKHEAD